MKPEDRQRTYRRMDSLVLGLMKIGTGSLLIDIIGNLTALQLPAWWAIVLGAWSSWFLFTGAIGLALSFLPLRMLQKIEAWLLSRRRR